MVDPITILAGIKTGLAAGKSIAGLSKQIGQFFDATDQAKKTLQKKGVSNKSANARHPNCATCKIRSNTVLCKRKEPRFNMKLGNQL